VKKLWNGWGGVHSIDCIFTVPSILIFGLWLWNKYKLILLYIKKDGSFTRNHPGLEIFLPAALLNAEYVQIQNSRSGTCGKQNIHISNANNKRIKKTILSKGHHDACIIHCYRNVLKHKKIIIGKQYKTKNRAIIKKTRLLLLPIVTTGKQLQDELHKFQELWGFQYHDYRITIEFSAIENLSLLVAL